MTNRPKYGTSSISKVDVIDPTRLKEATEWVQQVLGKEVSSPDGDFFDALKSGILLCELLNTIKPGSCKKFKESKMAFVQRSNIQIYIQGCGKLGVPETDCFETRDLFDRQRLSAVVDNLFSLSAQSRKVGFQGPGIGVDYHTENKRNFSQETLNKGKSTIASWAQGSRKTKTSNTVDSYGIVKTEDGSHTGVQSTWETGAVKQNTSNMDSYGIVKTEDGSHSGVQSSWETGAVKQNTNNMDSYGIVKTSQN